MSFVSKWLEGLFPSGSSPAQSQGVSRFWAATPGDAHPATAADSEGIGFSCRASFETIRPVPFLSSRTNGRNVSGERATWNSS